MRSAMDAYKEFLKSKRKRPKDCGFEPRDLNVRLYRWQQDIVRWACRKGRASIFADCGLGKTPMQLEWAYQVVKHTQGRVLILAPLAVAQQTVTEGVKFGIEVVQVRSPEQCEVSGIYITNYEIVEKFDLSSFEGVVLDESSIIKAHDSKTRTYLTHALDPVRYVLCCTATPAPNDQMELGNHAEIMKVMTREEMLAMFFIHDGGNTSKWRLKGHAKQDFYEWLATWAVMISKPSDIGYPDGSFILPDLNIETITIECKNENRDTLFDVPEKGLKAQRRARKDSLEVKAHAIAERINKSNEPWIVWCDYNDESALLTSLIPDAVEVKGSDTPEHKVEAMTGFSQGKYRVIVSKPSICGFGMNWQHCKNMAFCGMSFSYEQFYQAVRRCWRFGQTEDVNVYVYTTIRESSSLETVNRKEAQVMEVKRNMIESMAKETNRQLTGESLDNVPDAIFADAEGDGWQMLLGDSVERLREFPDDMFGLSVFSPPFASLYTYSDSERDMGNAKTDDEFWQHFKFLITEIYRVMMPGRSVCIHCMQLPRTKQRDGVIGLKDFRGDIIRAFEDAGFIYHSEVCIWKDPVTAMQRTKALGLLHKTIRKDSSMSRQGIADYVVVMRKPGQNAEPIAHSTDEFPVSLWQKWASPIWSDINPSNTLNGRNAREDEDERHICPLQLDVIERCIALWSNPGDVVLSPFGGIGSEGYQAIKMGREYIGIELKQSYFNEAVKNLRAAEVEKNTITLFDIIKEEQCL